VPGQKLAVSVVIPAYMAAGTLAQCLDSVLAAEVPSQSREIIVVDDGSDDGSARIAESRDITVVRIPHSGRSAALNRGLERATGDVVFFTDADCRVPRDWFSALLAPLAEDPALSGVGGNMLPVRINAVEVSKLLPYLDEFARDLRLAGEYSGACLNGNNMAIRRPALQDVGGFDESFIHGADADLTARLLAGGHLLLRIRHPVVAHLKRERLWSFLRTRFVRGSTVRFEMKRGRYKAADLLRDLARIPRSFFASITGLGRLDALPVEVPSRAGWFAPVISLLGEAVHWLGKVAFYRRFRAEASRSAGRESG